MPGQFYHQSLGPKFYWNNFIFAFYQTRIREFGGKNEFANSHKLCWQFVEIIGNIKRLSLFIF